MARTKGALNKRSVEARRVIRDAYPNYDPLRQLVKIANDPDSDQALKASCAKEVAQYLYAKLRAVEVTGQDGGPLQAIISAEPLSIEQWEKQNKG